MGGVGATNKQEGGAWVRRGERKYRMEWSKGVTAVQQVRRRAEHIGGGIASLRLEGFVREGLLVPCFSCLRPVRVGAVGGVDWRGHPQRR